METPLMSSRCALTANSQLYDRFPHPYRASSSAALRGTRTGLYIRALAPVTTPHVSTWVRPGPTTAGPCPAGLVRSQSGMKLLLLSTQERVAASWTFELLVTDNCGADNAWPRTYLPKFTLSAVFPLPNTSHAAAIFGVMSLWACVL